ncbi:hypothetical protein N5079_14590 [Planotetraspora sp. A-T 1434]|uniref:hypothetical protein n=1 Tax=Planotetraspora sp. A-T 1434 TaxID=2979219 RepID=UPI0021C20629|nr:hypothetical protein [Planotetraspora sp. A-T 1434]MCT9931446.1 hypothetical protein [Planotetraspora sp. A-T 1434]
MHGFPQNGKVTDPGYRPYVTKTMVDEAHSLGIKVIQALTPHRLARAPLGTPARGGIGRERSHVGQQLVDLATGSSTAKV